MQEEEKQVSLPFFGVPRLFPYLKPYRLRIAVMILLGGLSSAIDALYPLFNRYALNHFVGERTLRGMGIFIAVYADMLGDEGNWMPTDKGTWYMPFVCSKVLGGSDADYHFLEGEGINEFLCSLMDTLHFSCDTNYYSEPHLDSLVVVRNKGLTSFSSPDGQKYQLIDIK